MYISWINLKVGKIYSLMSTKWLINSRQSISFLKFDYALYLQVVMKTKSIIRTFYQLIKWDKPRWEIDLSSGPGGWRYSSTQITVTVLDITNCLTESNIKEIVHNTNYDLCD